MKNAVVQDVCCVTKGVKLIDGQDKAGPLTGASWTMLPELPVMAFSWSSKRLVEGSQVRVSEVKCSLKWSCLLNSLIVVLLTLSNNIAPLRINGRMTGCKRLLGSVKVNACVWSVGSAAKNLGRLLTVRSFTQHCIGQRK